MSSKLMSLCEVVIAVGCVVVVGDVVWTRAEHWRAANRTVPSSSQAARDIPEYAVGDAAPGLGVDYRAARKTLLMAVRSNCRFCAESMPFYRRLVAENAGGQLKMVAITSDSVSAFRKYLDSNGVALDDVVSINPGAVRVRGTPTLLLVNADGKISGVWVGRLSRDQEERLVAALRLAD